ncbi:hypothetical protein T484DRAFT_1942151 [Baffinella frigidus]|nr:hypothetical protein T484DRAFT_1942151 [Cryptophyta sp. CCMP2293]
MGWLSGLNPFKAGTMNQRQLDERRQIMVLSGEVEAMGDIFGRMNRQCYEKCIGESVRNGTAHEDELCIDEEKCLVNCATKFVRVQQRVMEEFVKESEVQAAAAGLTQAGPQAGAT